MAVIYTKVETDTDITYTGLGDALGINYIIKKDDSNLDVRLIAPVNSDPVSQTWQQIAAELDAYVS